MDPEILVKVIVHYRFQSALAAAWGGVGAVEIAVSQLFKWVLLEIPQYSYTNSCLAVLGRTHSYETM